MGKNDKTLRDKLLNIESTDSLSGKILKQSLLESEGRLGPRKRIENGILATGGILLLATLLHSLQMHHANWWYKRDDNILWICELAGIASSLLLVAVTGWQAFKGRCNDKWHPPLKAAGIAGSLFMFIVMCIWWLVVPTTVMGIENTGDELWRATLRSDETLIHVALIGIAPMLLVCVGTTVAVYWRVCREGARTREKMIETQCMIAELQEKLAEKKP